MAEEDMIKEENLPRKNGELVFQSPWESRAFGLALALNRKGLYDWQVFRDKLVEEISIDETTAGTLGYYERWIQALEKTVLDLGIITLSELEIAINEDDSVDHQQ